MSKSATGQLRSLSNCHIVGSFGFQSSRLAFCLRSYLRPQLNMIDAITPPIMPSQIISSQSACENRTTMEFPVGKNLVKYARAALLGALISMIGASISILGAIFRWVYA